MWLSFAIISVILLSASSILEKKALVKEHALEFSAYLSFYCFLISIPLFFIFNDGRGVELIPLVTIAITAIIGGIAFLLVVRSIRHMEISEVSPIIAIGPAMAAILAFIFLGEHLSALQVTGLIVIIFGIYILELKNIKNLFSPFKNIFSNKYIHFILIAQLLYGVTDVLCKTVLSKYHMKPELYLFYYQLFLALFYFVLLQVKQNKFEHVAKTSRNQIFLIIIIAIFTLGYRVTHLYAISLISIGIAIAIHRSSTLITTVIGGKLYKEGRIIQKSFAAVIVILGVVLVAM